MVTFVNLANNASYTPSAGVSVSYQKTINVTVIPIPLSDNPYLLNFGGANINITFDFDVFSVNDITTILNNFDLASNTSGYQIQLPEWNSTFTAFASQASIKQEAGEGNHWKVSITFAVGSLI